MIKVKKLVWDRWNLEHIKKHSVTKEEVEVVGRAIIFSVQTYDNRIRIVGRVRNRILSIILNPQDEANIYYVVTARDADKKERRDIYEIEKQKNP